MLQCIYILFLPHLLYLHRRRVLGSLGSRRVLHTSGALVSWLQHVWRAQDRHDYGFHTGAIQWAIWTRSKGKYF